MLPQIGSIEELEIEEDVENIEAQMLNRDLEPASNIPEEITEEIKENMPSPLQQTLMIQKHNILAKNLEKLLFQEDFADIEIMAGDPPEKILAHRQILAAGSPVFKKMLYGAFAESKKRQIQMPNIQPNVMRKLLQFIYTGCLEIDDNILVELIQATDQYELKEAKIELEKAAHHFISKASHDSQAITKVLKILCDSTNCQLEELQKICLEFVDVHTEDILCNNTFMELPKEILNLILERDTLSDEIAEVQLYLGVLRWGRGYGNIDLKDEKQYSIEDIPEETLADIKNILKNIRLPQIPAEIIITKIEPSKLVDIERLYCATAFQAAPKCFESSSSQIFKQRHGPNIEWIWSKEQHGSHISLSNGSKTAQGCHVDWEEVIGNVVWRSGIHRYEIIVEINMLTSSNKWQIICGVAHPYHTNLNKFLGATDYEWGMMVLSGQKIHDNIVTQYSTPCKRGDTIAVIVDLINGTLEFLRNGQTMGVAFNNVKGPVAPCVALCKGQKVTILRKQKTTQ